MDNVRAALKTIYLQPIAGECLERLSTDLKLYHNTATRTASAFLQEDPDIVQRRAELQATESILSQALSVINAFGTGALKVEN